MTSVIRFPSTASSSSLHSFHLLELPGELLKLIESEALPPGGLTIKGRVTDDAVLCTPTSTYAIRGVEISNSLVLATSPELSLRDDQYGEGTIVIRDELHQVLELVPIVPKLERMDAVLKGAEYGDENADEMDVDGEERPNKRQRINYEQLRGAVQASEAELKAGMLKARVLTIDGELRPLPLPALTQFLLQTLNALVSESCPVDAVPVESLAETLNHNHDVQHELTEQAVTWFGEVKSGIWKVDIEAVVKQVGLGLLSEFKHEPVEETAFIAKWKDAVGDSFEEKVSLDQLVGNYLSSDTEISSRPPTTLRYFPASALSIAPPARFTDLFLTRAKWRADAITPFVEDIAVDGKARDKLLLKFCRTTTDEEGRAWYTARAKY